MTEIDALKYDLEETKKSFDKLHEKYLDLLKQQGELEKENKELKENEQKIIDVLDKHIHYAETQAHNNLDNVIVYNSYRMLSYTIKLIADELGIELEGLN